MPPRKSKAARRSLAHSDVTSESPQTNGSALGERARTNWSTVDSSSFPGFTIKYLEHYKQDVKDQKRKAILKRKLQAEIDQPDDKSVAVQDNPFEGTSLPDLYYAVEPPEYWEDTSRYRKFTIGTETFTVDDYVYIKASEDQDPDPNAPIKGWVARVLEVRAGDEQHVYLRVDWMYRPEDLPGGRRPYHGQNELIASNEMQILDATSVEGKANVKQWVEQDDKNETLDADQLFWRQTLECSKPRAKKLSELPLHCVDQAPCNPDQLLVQCSACHKWLHGTCIEQAAIREAYKSHKVAYPNKNLAFVKKGEKKPAKGKSTRGAVVQKGKSRIAGEPPIGLEYQMPTDLLFSAQIIDEGNRIKLSITDNRPGQKSRTSEVPLRCLLCHKGIEQTGGAEDTESDLGVKVQEAKKATPEKVPARQRDKKDSVTQDGEDYVVSGDKKKRKRATSSGEPRD